MKTIPKPGDTVYVYNWKTKRVKKKTVKKIDSYTFMREHKNGNLTPEQIQMVINENPFVEFNENEGTYSHHNAKRLSGIFETPAEAYDDAYETALHQYNRWKDDYNFLKKKLKTKKKIDKFTKGTRVDIKNGEWGYIEHFDGDHYHISIAGDKNCSLIFRPDEITRSEYQDRLTG